MSPLVWTLVNRMQFRLQFHAQLVIVTHCAVPNCATLPFAVLLKKGGVKYKGWRSLTFRAQTFDNLFSNRLLVIPEIYIVLRKNMDHLLNKPYVNEVTLRENPKNPASPLKWCYPYWRGLDLSKEALWVSVGQLAAKLQAVKVGGLKRILLLDPSRITRRCPGSNPE